MMSVKVDLDQLAAALEDFTFAYLVTVGDDYRAHTVAVSPVFTDGLFEVGAVGKHTRANVSAREDVTVIWPPRQDGGYTLIVDGHGRLTDLALRVVPTRAVLHRSATPESPATSPDGLHDCMPLEG
jgi:hypothetical protein